MKTRSDKHDHQTSLSPNATAATTAPETIAQSNNHSRISALLFYTLHSIYYSLHSRSIHTQSMSSTVQPNIPKSFLHFLVDLLNHDVTTLFLCSSDPQLPNTTISLFSQSHCLGSTGIERSLKFTIRRCWSVTGWRIAVARQWRWPTLKDIFAIMLLRNGSFESDRKSSSTALSSSLIN